jgi:hypothetical protein
MSKISYEHLAKVSNEYATVITFWSEYSKTMMFQDNRRRENIILKHAFFVACKQLTTLSLASIGGIIGKDHATVLHAVKNHSNNLVHLNGYLSIYNEIVDNLEKRLNLDSIVNEANSIRDLSELRSRLIRTSSRLRLKIKEVNDLRQNHRLSLKEENDFLKKHSKQLHERNKKLEKELARLKNLI